MSLRPARIRMLALGCAVLAACLSAPARADVLTIGFTAVVGTSNNMDADNLFRQGAGASLSNQTVTGFASIDPTPLSQGCASASACYNDSSNDAITVSFTVGGVTQSVTSSLAGAVRIKGPTDGGLNYLSIIARTPRGGGNVIEEELGALFNGATLFSGYRGDDASNAEAATAIGSLSSIRGGTGLVTGGITLMTADGEHLDATLTSIRVDEPGSLTVLSAALSSLCAVFHVRTPRRMRRQRA